MSKTYKPTKAAEEVLSRIVDKINACGGIIKKEQLSEMGIDYRRILNFVESGALIRIKNGYYTDRMDRFTEEELVAKLFPDGVLCMESALFAYGYITERPYGWRVAVDKNTSKSRFNMDYPKVIPYYTEPESLSLGVTSITVDGNTYQIYEKDRMICDCLKYETKMERDIFRKAVWGYINDEDKDISMLMEYARQRKVIKKVQSLIGVWL